MNRDFAMNQPSVTAAYFGISKFLKSGPCRFIKSDTILLGFRTLSYLLLFLNIVVTMVAKSVSIFRVIWGQFRLS